MNNVINLLHYHLHRSDENEKIRIARFYEKDILEREDWLKAFSGEDAILKLES